MLIWCDYHVFMALIFMLEAIAEVHPLALRWEQIHVPRNLTPSPRKYAAMGGQSNSKRGLFLVIFGGMSNDGNALNDTWVLDVSMENWHNPVSNSSPQHRFSMVSGIYNGKFYIAGGCNNDLCFNDVWSFNMNTFQWAEVGIKGTTWPTARMSAAGGIFFGASDMLVSEGREGTDYLSDTYLLDLIQRQWFLLESHQMTYSPSLPHARAFHSSAMISPFQMVMFGGCVKEDSSMGILNVTNGSLYVVLFGGNTHGGQVLGGAAPIVTSGASVTPVADVLYVFGGENVNGARYFEEKKSMFLKCHFWLGLAVFTLPIANISLGLFLAMSDSAIWISWFVYVAFMMIILIIIQTFAVFSDSEEAQDDQPQPERF